MSFVKEGNLDYAGFFAYSREEGTPADRLDGHLPEAVKEKRANRLIDLQKQVIKKRNRSFVGKTVTVIYDGIDYDRQMFVGRMSTQAPDIDGVIYFTSEAEVNIGEFYKVQIASVDGVDLFGRVENEIDFGN